MNQQTLDTAKTWLKERSSEVANSPFWIKVLLGTMLLLIILF